MKIKLLKDGAKPPQKARVGDAGFDLYSPIDLELLPGTITQVKLGITIEINVDEVAITSERSGMALRSWIDSIGNVIDSNYRGEISIILRNYQSKPYQIMAGDRIGQLLILRLGDQSLKVVDALTETDRGAQNHGSSGK